MSDDGKPGPASALGKAPASAGRIVLVLFTLLMVFAGLMVHRGILREAKRTKARAEMAEICKAIAIFLSLNRPLRGDPADLFRPMAREGSDPILDMDIGDDPWGHPYGFTIDGPHAATITCLGADGAPGGEGADEDIVLRWPPPKDPPPR